MILLTSLQTLLVCCWKVTRDMKARDLETFGGDHGYADDGDVAVVVKGTQSMRQCITSIRRMGTFRLGK